MGLKNYFKSNKVSPIAAAAELPSHNGPVSGVATAVPSTAASTIPNTAVNTRPSSPSRPVSIAPSHRTVRSTFYEDIKYEVMSNYIFQNQCVKMWVGQYAGESEGNLIRRAPGDYIASPPELIDSVYHRGACSLNLAATMTIDSRVLRSFLSWSPNALDIPMDNGLRIQVLPNMECLSRARKNQGAAVVAEEGLLVLWDDDANNLLPRGDQILAEITKLIWTGGDMGQGDEKKGPIVSEVEYDPENGNVMPDVRNTHIQNAALASGTLFIVIAMLGFGWKDIALEIAVDGKYLRLLLLLMTPVQIFFTLFFSNVITGCVAQMLGPVKQMTQNSKYYSAVCGPRLTGDLPHVTIQCPVYKEGLEGVIMPTVKSLKAAMATYEMQGGTTNIFVNDDGLQLISEEEREARINFYTDNNIGWVARPKHGENGFQRRGKFKKASNMNYALMISCKVEAKLAEIHRPDSWNSQDEAEAYGKALVEVLEGEQGRAWADGNIRIGDYILIIDSDTRVPADCLLDACSEMELSPQVGILQFSSGVMQVVNTYFENAITFFTNLIYSAIRFCVSNGDVAPFVGHNAILRWAAVQKVSYVDEDGYEKFWSESHVSEDFDMSLRLQCKGYIIRMAAWAGDGFKEGVSLTVYDELARWEKYAYGCNELLFHPLRMWIWKGPLTPLFRSFMRSNIPLTSKVTIIAYIGTYYAIGASWLLTMVNYFAVGWFNGYLDKYYLGSWKIWISIMVVFNLVGNVALATMRYRIGEKSWGAAAWECAKWIPLLCIFMGGLSLHVSSALLAHMFEVNMIWGATSKEAEWSNFFVEVPRVLNRFKYSMTWAIGMMVIMVVLSKASFVPWDWRIGSSEFTAIVPLCTVAASHLLLPIALNPALMTFSF